MPVPKAYAYDENTGQFLGKVPVTWFATFSHVKHTDADGNRPDVPAAQPKAAAVRTRKPKAAKATDTSGSSGDTKEASDGIAQ